MFNILINKIFTNFISYVWIVEIKFNDVFVEEKNIKIYDGFIEIMKKITRKVG